MKITVTSDLHGQFPEIQPCNVLCICGDIAPDFFMSFREKATDGIEYQANWFLIDFFNWCMKQPCDHVIFCAGNHDFALEGKLGDTIKLFLYNRSNGKIVFLRNGSLTHKGITFYGFSYCKPFGGWAFMPPQEEYDIQLMHPIKGVDVFLSHDPVFNVQLIDEVQDPLLSWAYKPLGSQPLRKMIENIQPRYFFCGHIHSGNHKLFDHQGIKMANVAYLNEQYKPAYEPFTFEIEPLESEKTL